MKLVLGWIIGTEAMTIHLPPHRVERLADVLASIPITQKRTSVKKWHKVLGELRSMALALPGARNLFSQMQHTFTSKIKTQTLDDFRLMLCDMSSQSTGIAELVPLCSSAEGYHDASGKGACGVCCKLTEPTMTQAPQANLWRLGPPGNPARLRLQIPPPSTIREVRIRQCNSRLY